MRGREWRMAKRAEKRALKSRAEKGVKAKR